MDVRAMPSGRPLRPMYFVTVDMVGGDEIEIDGEVELPST